MATLNYPTSPPATGSESDDKYIIDAAGFKAKVVHLTQAHKNILKIANLVYSTPKGQGKVTFPNGQQLGRSELNAYSAKLVEEMKELAKFFTASKRRRVHRNPDNNSGDQLRAMFYVSDQLVGFLREANLGDGNPSNIDITQADAAQAARQAYPEGSEKRPQQYMSLVFEKSMATSGILTSILSLYTTVNQVQSQTNGGRIKPDQLMLKYFGNNNTHYYLRGQDLTPANVPGNVKPDKREKFQKNLSQVNMPALYRIKARDTDPQVSHVDKRGKQVICYKEPVPAQTDDDYGMSYSMYMVLLNYFRIPNELLSPEQIAQLTDPANIALAVELQEYIRDLTEWHKSANKDAKKEIQTRRRRQQAQLKKMQQQAGRVTSPNRSALPGAMGGLPALPSIGGFSGGGGLPGFQ